MAVQAARIRALSFFFSMETRSFSVESVFSGRAPRSRRKQVFSTVAGTPSSGASPKASPYSYRTPLSVLGARSVSTLAGRFAPSWVRRVSRLIQGNTMPQLSHGLPCTGKETSAVQALRLVGAAPEAEMLHQGFGDDDEVVHWSEEDVVHLHCLLLNEIRVLADPSAAIEDMFDVLRWVFTEPENDSRPFSFASCLRVAGCSPESTFPFFGCVDPEDVRALIRHNFRKWFEQALERYPEWVRESIRENPAQAARQLARNPQCINRQVRSLNVQCDLFA
jgi:hypothetical protein